MIDKELEKEAEEYLENKYCKNVCTYNEIEECKKGIRIRCMSFNHKKELIVDFAEPREKHITELEKRCNELFFQVNEKAESIEELEKENERLRGDLELWESGACRTTNLDKCGIVKELEEENAELRARLNAINLLTPELEKRSKLKTQQLTKAKEIIKKFLLWENDWHDKAESKYELLKEAEQFISEMEK